jgi:putative CRISPR-associated protein (TIGR02619 family)
LGSADGRKKASAEIHSLDRLDCGELDEIILLTSDTAEGRACLEVLQETLKTIFEPLKVVSHRVRGLQARNGTMMKKEGIPNLLSLILPYVQDPQRRYGTDLILNPTGGFKGVVPFMTVVGMLYNVRVVYLFEFSEDLINLPPLPVTLDLELFERARHALQWAESQAVFTPKQFYSRIDGFEATEEYLFAGFLESDGSDLSTLSPIATALLEEESQNQGYIMVSKKVRDWLKLLHEEERHRLEPLACRLSSPLCRRSQRKAFHGTDLEVYGRKRFAARFAGYTEGNIFYLCLAEKVSNHDVYERQFAAHKRTDFARSDEFERLYLSNDSSSFEPDNTEFPETWSDLKRERDKLRLEVEKLKAALGVRHP